MKLKLFVTAIVLLFINCSTKMGDQNITDCGKTRIGDNVYIKKLSVSTGGSWSNDRIYLLVDENDKLVSRNVNVSSRVSQGKSSRIQSNFIVSE